MLAPSLSTMLKSGGVLFLAAMIKGQDTKNPTDSIFQPSIGICMIYAGIPLYFITHDMY